MTFKERIEELLARLGSDPESVAENLKKAGVKGERSCPKSCPVARYLKKEIPEQEVGINVQPDEVYFLSEEQIGAGTEYCGNSGKPFVYLPLPVSMFVNQFDRRRYPDLMDAY